MEQEIDLRKMLAVLINRWYIIVAAGLAFGIAAFLVTEFAITPLYAASGTMYVYNTDNRKDNATITSSDISTSQKLVDTYIVIMQSDSVLDAVAEDVNLGYQPKEISKMFTASAINGTEIFKVTITNENQEHAQKICNSFLKISRPEIIRVVQAGSVEIIDNAKLPTQPVSPNKTKNVAMAVLIGLVLSAMAVILVEMFDTKIKTEDDITSILNIPIIGSIPTIIDDEVKK